MTNRTIETVLNESDGFSGIPTPSLSGFFYWDF